MDRGLAVPTTRVRCGSGTVGTPPAGPALPTATRGSPLRLAGLGHCFVCGFGFDFVSVVIASTTWLVRLRLVRLRLVRRLPVRIGLVRVGLVRVGPIRA
ncbi:hypothetical protein ACKI2E_20210 [Streptomyces galilaeus]|uniref:hypothetical protein n=1 Tax=Streptomyces galilaeus TaxID=33899 RepID=UPI0038F62E24